MSDSGGGASVLGVGGSLCQQLDKFQCKANSGCFYNEQDKLCSDAKLKHIRMS